MSELDILSKYISRVLRHRPEDAGIGLDEHGWADVEALIAGVNAAGKRIDRKILEEIVRTDKKQRYSFNENGTLIRANQGHSIPVDVELAKLEPPEYLYHGTAYRFLESIRQQGLLPMSRLYVHLSGDVETARVVGKRHGRPVVLKIHSGDMHRDGFPFYRSQNGVWLAKKVDAKYFEQLEEA
jgi:RNA:NAD 2''-phosphotransferase